MGELLRGTLLLIATVLSVWVVFHWLLFSSTVTPVYDFIVVGGGSTGSVVAGRLGQAGFSVLVLEAGGKTQATLGGADVVAGKMTIFDVPLGWVQILSDHRWSKQYQWDIPADPPPAIARGVGGCGIHNAMLYMRGRPEDFDKWGRGWSWDDVLPFYLRSENNRDFPASDLHARDGPVHIQFGSMNDSISEAFIEACAAAGVPKISDFNGPSREGVGRYQFMIRNGVRDSAAAAYIGQHSKPASVSILPHALVTRMFFNKNKRVEAVEFVVGRAPAVNAPRQVVRVRKEVILSAGAIMSPKLLLLSGIGDASALKRLNISVVHDNAAVGAGLADGVYGIMQWSTRQGNFIRCRLERGSKQSTAEDGPHDAFCAEQHKKYDRGQRDATVFGSPGLSVGAFLKSPWAVGDEPDVQLTLHPWDKYSRTWKTSYDGIASMEIANNHPRSRGQIALRSARFSDPPEFIGPYLLDVNDSLPLRWAIREMRKIAKTPPLGDFILDELIPGPQVTTEEQLLDTIQCGPHQFRSRGHPACDRSELPVNHLAGTCRLGEAGDPHAVVDLELRVLGVHGVRVADASVMPRPPSGNTHATCMMIGERAAQFVIAEWQSHPA